MSSLELIQTLVEAGYPAGNSLSPLDFDWLWQTDAHPFLKWFCTLDSRHFLSDQELQEFAKLDVSLQTGKEDLTSAEVYSSGEEQKDGTEELRKNLEALDQELEQMKRYEEILLSQDDVYSQQMERLEEDSKQTGAALRQVRRNRKTERDQVLLCGERLDKSLTALLSCCESAANQVWVCLDGSRQRNDEASLLSAMMAAKAPPMDIKTPTQVESEFEYLQNRIQDTEGFHLKCTLDLEASQKVLKFYDGLLQHPDPTSLLASHQLGLEVEQAKNAAHYSAQKVQKMWEKEVTKNFQLQGEVVRKRLELSQTKEQTNRLKRALLDWTHTMMDHSLSQAARLQLLFLGHNMEQRSLQTVRATMAAAASLAEQNQVRTDVDTTPHSSQTTQLILKEDCLAQFLVSVLGNEDLRTSLFNTYPDLVAAIQQARKQQQENKMAFQDGLKSLLSDIAVLESHHQEALRITQHDQASNFLADLTSLQQDYNHLQTHIRTLVKDLEGKKKLLSEDKLKELERSLYIQFYISPAKFKSTLKHLMSQAENEKLLLHSFAN